MNLLYGASNILSYTDCIPLINIPSGVVHLMIGVSESFFNKRENSSDQMSLKARTWSGLEQLTHLQKGLAIGSIVGTALLVVKTVEKFFEYRRIIGYIRNAMSMNNQDRRDMVIPDRLRGNSEWVYQVYGEGGLPFWSVTTGSTRADKRLVLSLALGFSSADFDCLVNSLKQDKEVCLALDSAVLLAVFPRLSENLRKDLDLIEKLSKHEQHYYRTREGAREARYNIAESISDKAELTKFPRLLATAFNRKIIAIQQDKFSAQLAALLIAEDPTVLFREPRLEKNFKEEQFQKLFWKWIQELFKNESSNFIASKQEVIQIFLKNRQSISQKFHVVSSGEPGGVDAVRVLTEKEVADLCATPQGMWQLFYPGLEPPR